MHEAGECHADGGLCGAADRGRRDNVMNPILGVGGFSGHLGFLAGNSLKKSSARALWDTRFDSARFATQESLTSGTDSETSGQLFPEILRIFLHQLARNVRYLAARGSDRKRPAEFGNVRSMRIISDCTESLFDQCATLKRRRVVGTERRFYALIFSFAARNKDTPPQLRHQ